MLPRTEGGRGGWPAGPGVRRAAFPPLPAGGPPSSARFRRRRRAEVGRGRLRRRGGAAVAVEEGGSGAGWASAPGAAGEANGSPFRWVAAA